MATERNVVRGGSLASLGEAERRRLATIVLGRIRPAAVAVVCVATLACLALASAATSARAGGITIVAVPPGTPIQLAGPGFLVKEGVEPPTHAILDDDGFFQVVPDEPLTAPAVLYTAEAEAAASGPPAVMRVSWEVPILMSAAGKLETAHPEYDVAIFNAMRPIGEALKRHDFAGLTAAGESGRLLFYSSLSSAERELIVALSEVANDPSLSPAEADVVFQLGRGVKWEEISLDQRMNLPTDVLLDAIEGVAPLPPSDLPPVPPLSKDPEGQPANAAAEILTETQEQNVVLAEEEPQLARATDEIMHEVDSPSLPSVAATTEEDLEYASKDPKLAALSQEIGTSPQDPVKLTPSGGLETTAGDLENLSDKAGEDTTEVTKQAVSDVKGELAGSLKPEQLVADAKNTLSPELERDVATAQFADQALKDGTPGAGVSSKATGALGAAKIVASEAVEETSVAVEDGAVDGAEAAIEAGEATASVVDPLMLVQIASQLPQIITQIVQLIKGEPNFEQQVLSSLDSIKEQIGALSEQVTQGFVFTDQILAGIGTKIDQDTQLLEHVAANGSQLQSDLAEITGKLDQIQATLYRIAESAREESLNTALNTYIGYNQRFGEELPGSEFAKALGIFFTWGDQSSLNAVSEHKGGSTAPNQVAAELQGTEGANALNENLDYLANFADKADWLDGLPALNQNVPNPEVWATASNAYSQLLLENTGQVTTGVRSSIGELESTGQSLRPFIEEITEKGSAYAPMEVDGVKIDTGSSILNHALANYLDSAVAPTAGAGKEPSLANRIRAQQNAALATQPAGAADESYGHCSTCKLAVAPTAERGDTGEALIDPWAGPYQAPSEHLPRLETASDPLQKNGGSVSHLGEMNLCRPHVEVSSNRPGETGYEATLPAWLEQGMFKHPSGEEQQANALLVGIGSFEGAEAVRENIDPLPTMFTNAWHLGFGRLISCYAPEFFEKGIRLQVNYFWEWPGHIRDEKQVLLRVTMTDPLPKAQGCFSNPVEAVHDLWNVEVWLRLNEKHEGNTCWNTEVTGLTRNEIEPQLGNITAFVKSHTETWPLFHELEQQINSDCKKETGDLFACEVQIEPGPFTDTAEHLSGGSEQAEAEAEGALPSELSSEVRGRLAQLRRVLNKHVAETNASESLSEEAPADVQQAAVRVNGARALLDDYIQLGMPGAMSNDSKLRNFVLGASENLAALEKSGGHLPDNTPGAPNIYSVFTKELGEIEGRHRPPVLWPTGFGQEPCVEGCPAEVGLDERGNPIAEELIEGSPKRRHEHDGVLTFAFKRAVELLSRRLHAHLVTEEEAAHAEEPLVEAAATQLGLIGELLSIAPVNMVVPAVTGSPHAGETLHCSPGEWEARPAPTFSYAWLRDGAGVGSTQSYVLTAADVGQEMSCEATARLRGDAASAMSAPVTVLAPVAPVVSPPPEAPIEEAPHSPVVVPTPQVVKALANPNLKIGATQKLKGSKAGFSARELTVPLGRSAIASRGRRRSHRTPQVLEYQITVANTGNVPLVLTKFSDPYCGHVSSGAPAGGGLLQPGASAVYSCRQTVARDGTFLNQATIEATPPLGDGFGLTRVSNETVALGPNPEPTAETGGVLEAGQNTALVAGRVNPHGRTVTSCTFEYWATSAVHRAPCTKSPGHGTSFVKVTGRIEGLYPDTTYHYRLAAGNRTGTSRGNPKELTAPAAPEATA